MLKFVEERKTCQSKELFARLRKCLLPYLDGISAPISYIFLLVSSFVVLGSV
jgi:hypothetical protein